MINNLVLPVMAIIILLISCTHIKQNTNSNTPEKIILDLKIDSLEGSDNLDALLSEMDCDDTLINSITHVNQISDSIRFVYEQIIIRLDSINHPNKKNAEQIELFKKWLKFSMNNYIELIDADQRILFYSYGNATMQRDAANCYKIILLRKRLAFLKGVFANAYWNYEFESLLKK